MTVFVFDIETIPDIIGGQKIYDLQGLSDADTAKALQQIRRQQSGNDFMRPYLQKIIAISMVMEHEQQLKVWSLGQADSSERELIRQFFGGIAKYTPTLVSWNGCGFDLPVLHYRSLLHGVSAPRYWEQGEGIREFRYDNYYNRYHWRHIDLMDVLAGFQPRMVAPLDHIATLLGFPGKLGMDGSKVWDAYQAGDIQGIRDYCETDVLNTYLVYLRFQLMRGQIDYQQYEQSCERLNHYLQNSEAEHFQQFVATWAWERA